MQPDSRVIRCGPLPLSLASPRQVGCPWGPARRQRAVSSKPAARQGPGLRVCRLRLRAGGGHEERPGRHRGHGRRRRLPDPQRPLGVVTPLGRPFGFRFRWAMRTWMAADGALSPMRSGSESPSLGAIAASHQDGHAAAAGQPRHRGMRPNGGNVGALLRKRRFFPLRLAFWLAYSRRRRRPDFAVGRSFKAALWPKGAGGLS
jgi:hypothetical protein